MCHFALYMSKVWQSCQSKKWDEAASFHTGGSPAAMVPTDREHGNIFTICLIWFALTPELAKPPGNVKQLQQHETSTDQRVREIKKATGEEAELFHQSSDCQILMSTPTSLLHPIFWSFMWYMLLGVQVVDTFFDTLVHFCFLVHQKILLHAYCYCTKGSLASKWIPLHALVWSTPRQTWIFIVAQQS